MEQGTPLICTPVVGDPATLRRFPNRDWGLISCLPCSQGCVFNLSLGDRLRFAGKFRIYDDVLQLLAITRITRGLRIEHGPIVTIEAAGISGVQSVRKILEHCSERLRLSTRILLSGEPILAAKYLVGMSRVVGRYLALRRASTGPLKSY
jgi:hypothetical protein